MKLATAESVMIEDFRPPAPTRRTPRRIAKRRIEKAARGNPSGLSMDAILPVGPGRFVPNYCCTDPGCKRIADVPWPLVLGRKGTTRKTLLGNIPLRCQRCGNGAPIIGVRHQGNG